MLFDINVVTQFLIPSLYVDNMWYWQLRGNVQFTLTYNPKSLTFTTDSGTPRV